MVELNAIIRLQTWLSPAFPTGAFSYSGGLEAAIQTGIIKTKNDLEHWLVDIIHHGSGWNDAVLLAESWRLVKASLELNALCQLGAALCFSSSRLGETLEQGRAFNKAAQAWGGVKALPHEAPLPICVGATAAHHEIELEHTLVAYLHAQVSNQTQAALRLMKLGQTGNLELLSRLEKEIVSLAEKAARSGLDDLASSTFIADLASLKHETLQSRIFRS